VLPVKGVSSEFMIRNTSNSLSLVKHGLLKGELQVYGSGMDKCKTIVFHTRIALKMFFCARFFEPYCQNNHNILTILPTMP
jgi:hypothetical protein